MVDRDEIYRPQYHFSPVENWMNDPNGLIHLAGEYHLFFQYNPEGTTWGNISWGHAVSPDLLHWKELPIAIQGSATERIFSGSVVLDRWDSSGFGAPGVPVLVAVYTSWYESGTGHQAQSLAYSQDRGRTWTKYPGNPVLTAEPDGRDPFDFRDPKVFWFAPQQTWVMVLALPVDRRVAFYGSCDLRAWWPLSEFGPAGAAGGVWECPDLFELPVDGSPARTRWVLSVSLNPGAVAGGSGAQYFVGDFDGTTFTPDPVGAESEPRWLDFGADYYAPVTWNDAPDGRRLAIGWMNNWQYADEVPTAPWRSISSLPRELTLQTVNGRIDLVQQPVREVVAWRPEPSFTRTDLTLPVGTTGLDDPAARGSSLSLDLRIDVGAATAVGLRVRTGPGEQTVIGYDADRREVYLDRRRCGRGGFHPAFPGIHRAPLRPEGLLTLQIYVDRSSVEVFADRGQVVLTDQIFPGPDSTGVELFAEGGAARLVSLTIRRLPGVW